MEDQAQQRLLEIRKEANPMQSATGRMRSRISTLAGIQKEVQEVDTASSKICEEVKEVTQAGLVFVRDMQMGIWNNEYSELSHKMIFNMQRGLKAEQESVQEILGHKTHNEPMVRVPELLKRHKMLVSQQDQFKSRKLKSSLKVTLAILKSTAMGYVKVATELTQMLKETRSLWASVNLNLGLAGMVVRSAGDAAINSLVATMEDYEGYDE
ncbi:hypothetical protein LTR10_020647 [Elasticomyces elasticus]|uniref:Uncharacterized protein n=1 Tax=Exophiala sideris TaxID=1016849 RepID=A0ABR0J7L0_9EURO|nr:hypothetical protein LTR10_020647 [Elasticomyces elasticus]KAK5029997.1 hypothetical protein LTS07_005721 [Exophiala sideris]KAK5031562.1 hypothetical protein LTR13_007551 [Exophiala sideris]KAK5058239.1 hypothetical protein LTR69_006643 [Exophiala sideris]KAK5180169.1 hypothetical protein LTR44_007294 [Eurotiomycetes sp. CCFEE 6388]